MPPYHKIFMVTFTISQCAWVFARSRDMPYLPCVPAWSTCPQSSVPNGVPNFQIFFLRNAKGNFYILLLYKKFCIILDIIVVHMICICFIHKNCIMLHFYTSCHIKEKCAGFLFFEKLCSLVKNEKKDLVSIRN